MLGAFCALSNHISGQTLIAEWFIPLSAQLPMSMTSLKAMACCMVRNLLCSLMLGTGVSISERKLPVWPGKSPCVRAKVEHPFRVIKCQFGFTKVRYKGLAKNTAQLIILFALSNLWMARRQLMGA